MTTTRSLRSNERGIALALALFAMVIATLLITAVFYIARIEQRMGNNQLATAQAREAAEYGLSAVLTNWNTGTYNALATGGSVSIASTNIGGGGGYSGTLRKLTPTTFLIQVTGTFSIGGQVITRRQLARIVRLNQPTIQMSAAITTRVGMTVSGSSQIGGRDTVPASMSGICPVTGATVPGIRDSSGNVTTSGACSGASCITGSPRILTDPTVSSATFTQFGDLTFNDLAAMADKSISGTMNGLAATFNVGTPTTCRTTDLTNWGDPLNPSSACGGYFPIVYAPGDVRLTGGWGQGILLVGGNLDISGGTEFYGPVIVLGTVRSTGTGGHIYGGLMAQNADLSITLVSGNSVVDYSSCTLSRAIQGTSRAKALRERSWAQQY